MLISLIRWRHTIGLICSFLLFMLTISGCSEEMKDNFTPGSSLVDQDVIIRDTVVAAIGGSTFKYFTPMDSRISRLRQNLIGRNGNYTAYSLLQFFLPYRDSINILSAKLTLRAVTFVGDSASAFGFTAHKINYNWNQSTFRWDSLSMRSDFYASNSVGSFSGRVTADTQQIAIVLDTALVRTWHRFADTPSYGLILIPTQSTNVVRGLHAFDFDSTKFYPTLEVIAKNLSGTVTDTVEYLLGADTWVGNIDGLENNPQLYTLQAGVTYRSRLDFDLSFIKRGSIINSAELVLLVDPTNTRWSKFTTDSLVTAHLLLGGSDSSLFEASAQIGKRKIGTTSTYTFDVRRSAQFWISGLNNGLLLRHSDVNEYSSLDRISFFSHSAVTPALRPSLVLKYTVQKN